MFGNGVFLQDPDQDLSCGIGGAGTPSDGGWGDTYDMGDLVELFPNKELGAMECPTCESQWFMTPVVVDLDGHVTAHGVEGVCIECGAKVQFV